MDIIIVLIFLFILWKKKVIFPQFLINILFSWFFDGIILYNVHEYYSILLCIILRTYNFVINFYNCRISNVSLFLLFCTKKFYVSPIIISCYMYFLLNVIKWHYERHDPINNYELQLSTATASDLVVQVSERFSATFFFLSH